MWEKNKKLFFAIATFAGTIIGVGIFAVPYAVSQSSFLVGLAYLVAISLVLLFLYLSYSEVILQTKGKHRLVGYSEIYLGKWGKRLTGIINIGGIYGALIAYIIVSGNFLFTIFNKILGGTPFLYSLAFFFVFAIFIFIGLKLISEAEFVMTALLFLVFAIIFVAGAPFIKLSNLTAINSLDLKNLFLPYGIILFALAGATAIPEMREMLERKSRQLRKAIFIGFLIATIFTIIFTLTIVGISGAGTSVEAISGLAGILGGDIIILGAILGLLAVATSFLVLGINLKNVFSCDFKINKTLAGVLVCGVPFLIYLLGSPSLVHTIGVTGAIFGGLEGIIIVLICLQLKKKDQTLKSPKSKNIFPSWLGYGIIGVFVVGIIYEIVYLLI